MLILTESSIVLVHGLRGHPFQTWASNQQLGDERTEGPTSRRQHIRSFFKPTTSPFKSNSTQEPAVSRTQQVFWPKEYLAEDIPQARVWTYGYNADVIGGLFQANDKNCVSAHGRDLAVRLERDIDNEVTSPTAKSRNGSVDVELVPHYIYSPQPGRHSCQRCKTRVLLSNLTT